ncbi:MAG: 23S rRNA (uracil(1939)-C(5))-methyltransferase RlmD [Planctomycetota bacterium]
MTATPHCRHFGTCGGCTRLDVAIAAQLTGKHAAASAVLAPVLDGVPLAQPPTPAATPCHDRTKLLYPIQPGPGGELRAGLYARGTHELVDIEECMLQVPALTELAHRWLGVLRARGVAPYDERRHRGWLRALFARIAAGTGEMVAALVTTDDTLPLHTTLVPQLVDAAAGLPALPDGPPVRLVGLVQNVNPAPGNALLGTREFTRHGRGHVFDRQDGLTFRISAGSFYQVHRDASALLYRPAMAMLGDVRGQRVVDAYGGVGTFALRLAAAGAAAVHLVETSPSACADARAAATSNRLADRVVVTCAPFGAAQHGLGPPLADPDLLVIDPPRAGLDAPGLAEVRRLDARRILYVACSLTALARDLARLSDRYRPQAAHLCDIFPHTDHVEALVLLHRRVA